MGLRVGGGLVLESLLDLVPVDGLGVGLFVGRSPGDSGSNGEGVGASVGVLVGALVGGSEISPTLTVT